MPITDLTGTKWQLNSTVSIPFESNIKKYYSLQFTFTNYKLEPFTANYLMLHREGGNRSVAFITATSTSSPQIYYSYNNETVSLESTFMDAAPELEILGGSDATSDSSNFAEVLSWLQSNGNLVPEPVTKLTFNLSDYPGWQALTPGQTYAITLIAHDNDGVYADSDPSVAVNVLRPLDYEYTRLGSEITLITAPYTRAGSEVTIT